jgi:hypothetical protein
MIKEFTPLLGYISWSNFQWIFVLFGQSAKICALQCSKFQIDGSNGFRMFKNPYLGFFGTSFGHKLKRIGFLEVPLQTCCLWITKMHPCLLNLAPTHIYV